jgi:Zn-dependent M28 family amino/carboxypeptidase
VLTAKAHGAAAVLIVNDTATHSGPDNLEKLSALPSPGSAGLPFAGIRSGIVEEWFQLAGRDFADTQADIDRRLEPVSFDVPGVEVEIHTEVVNEQRMVSNVVGYIPGTTSEYVIVGAHYDHLGNGEQFSLSGDNAGAMHPGADDNASGTAAVMAIARWFGSQRPMRRGVLLVTFAGEEVGLLGSTWFTQSPPLPLRDAVAMINMDMIGRMREKSLIVGGVDSGTGLRPKVEAAAKGYPFELQTGSQAVYGSSDHTSFTSHGIPALFFFTGLHADYHRPGDTVDKIDRRNTPLIADLVADIAAAIADAPDRPVFRGRSDAKTCPDENNPHTRSARLR